MRHFRALFSPYFAARQIFFAITRLMKYNIPILLYGLEACLLFKSDLSSLDFVVNRLFMKLFKTSNIDAVQCCQDHFGFDLPSVNWSRE